MNKQNISNIAPSNTSLFSTICKATVVTLFTVMCSSCDVLMSAATDTAADAATYAANYNYSNKAQRAAQAQRALQNY